jgi:nucleotide-binding universal stress UspA family protein
MLKKYLVVVDESQELENAIYFAASRAQKLNRSISLLYVIDHAINAQWSKIENLIEQEATSDAKKICRKWAQKIKDRFGIECEIILKLGNRVDEILKLLREDKTIRFLILASASESEDPGPIIKALIGKKNKELSIPIVIVPGSMSEKDIDLIA